MNMTLKEIITKCDGYIQKQNYRSYDQFDALTNDFLYRISHNRELLRRIFIQIVSKSPVNLHGLGMKKMLHTKTISDLLWFYSVNKELGSTTEINHFFELLLERKLPAGFSWGLNFPYASRFIDADAKMPNLYNTANSGLSICHSYPYLNPKNKLIAEEALNGIVVFIEQGLGFVDENTKGWYVYYPEQNKPVYNVNALTLYLLAYIRKLDFNNSEFLDLRIRSLINLLREEQENNGSWYYSRAPNGKWIDGFHTGFILESLAFASKEGYEVEITKVLQKGWTFYLNKMFTKEGFAKYYLTSNKYPIESQNYAQSIQTLANISRWLKWDQKQLLTKIINITIDNLFDMEKGYFYYKKTKYFTYKMPYLRWAVTPMMLALSYAILCLEDKNHS